MKIRFIKSLPGFTALVFSLLLWCQSAFSASPNVILVLTDDQGMGDFSLYGNPVVKTPHLDALAREGVSFNQFHVTSMCSPTRGALLSGLNPLENGAISTCQGVHTIRHDIPTLPRAFAEAGYETGMFGKWHLGRNYPNRPVDKGFQEHFILYGFGTTGISSRWNNDYINTWVVHNGEEVQTEGFCTDVFFNQAMSWISERKDKPFFAYIPTNAPHFPFWAPKELTAKYENTKNPEFFAMVDNLDENMGRLDAFLEKEGLKENTIVIFMTDNGPVGGRDTWNAGMTGGKATPWEGGHRVPLFVRYPAGGIEGGYVVQGLSDVTDIYPTLMDLCDIQPPEGAKLTGISLKQAMRGDENFPERTLFMEIQQSSLTPKNAAVMRGDWRVLWSDSLYNVKDDLAQQHKIGEEHPEIFREMWVEFQAFFHKHRAAATAGQPEWIGAKEQPTVVLDSSYWMGVRADGQASTRLAASKNFGPEGGVWKVLAKESGKYSVTLRRWPIESGLALDQGCPPFQPECSGKPLPEGVALPISTATLEVDEQLLQASPAEDPTAITFELDLEQGEHTLQGIFRDEENRPLCGAFYAYIERK